jgi:hypothetical protein
MRKSLFSAAAAAPLALLAAAPAWSATTIDNARTTPVATSTANNGQPDDVTISSSGSVAVTGPVAVTLDSNNTLTNSGTISIKDVDGSTGVLIQGGHTGAFVNGGAVTINESYTATDTNNDGIVDGPYAKGTGRYGVRVIGASPFVGSLTINSTGAINVTGNNSFGLSVESPLQGDIIVGGTLSTLGDNSTALSISGPLTGKVRLAGAVNANGAGAIAADISGNITGSLAIYSAVQATGFRAIVRSSDPTVNAKLLPENLLLAGPSLRVRGDILGGLFIGAAPTGTTTTDTTTDADGDGIVDSAEGRGTLNNFGSAPALMIGESGRDVRLGAFGAGANNYGLIVRGVINGSGVFDNFGGAGVQIGVAGGTVHIDGGMRVVGQITAQGYEADSTAIHLLSGSQVPQFVNEGSVLANANSAKATNATALFLDAGSSITSLANTGTLTASLTGALGSAYAVVDKAGSIVSVTNTNTILADLVPAASGGTTLGRTVALDLSANTTGVSIVQSANADTTITPKIGGDILLGSGADTVQISAGAVGGALDFAGGQGSLSISGGAAYAGQLTSSGVMALSVSNGTLRDESSSAIAASSLDVGSSGLLVVTADPTAGKATRFNVSGSANIAQGGRLGLHLASLLPGGPQSYTIISAGTLSVPISDASLSGQTPYLYVAGFRASQAAGTVDLDIRRRTAQEAALNRSQTAAYDPVYNSLALDPNIQRAFLAQTDQGGLVSMLDQMLPDHAGGVFRALSWAAEQQGVAAGEPPLGEEEQGPTRAWTQEIVLSENKDAQQASAYRVFGFGIVGGVESVSSHGDALGVKVGLVTANVRNPDVPSDNLLGVSQLSAGAYWRGDFGGLETDAQLGAGFIWVNNRREFLFSDSDGVVHRVAKSNWAGYSLSGRLGARYTAELGNVILQPRVHVDYFRMHEGGYTEHGGGAGFDLAVDPRTGDQLSVTGTVLAGMNFGSTSSTGFRWRPQVEVGYRARLAGSAGTTTAQFVGAPDTITLVAESLRKSAAIGRAGLRIYSNYLDLLLDAGAEYNKDVTDIDVHLTARTVF